jgi:hypothetical protein
MENWLKWSDRPGRQEQWDRPLAATGRQLSFPVTGLLAVGVIWLVLGKALAGKKNCLSWKKANKDSGKY